MVKTIYRCRVCGKLCETPIHCGREAEVFLDGIRREKLSKLMSGLLRHFPYVVDLRVDNEGFVSLDELLDAIRSKWKKSDYSWVTMEHILAVASLDPKGRFEIKDSRIRARYGHSIDVSPRYERVVVDGDLFHGTGMEKLRSILREGLKPMKRRYVHLTSSIEDAWKRASISRNPVVLVIDGRKLSQDIGVYKASNIVYLTEYVPPRYIKKIIRKSSDFLGYNP